MFFNITSYITETLIYKNFILVFSALDETLLLLLISLPLGFVLSLIFALGRISKNTLISRAVASYIFTIRGTPLLVQIYLIYFGLGSVKLIRESFLWYALKEPFWCGVIALQLILLHMEQKFFAAAFNQLRKVRLNLVYH